jgi:hypothetical protein
LKPRGCFSKSGSVLGSIAARRIDFCTSFPWQDFPDFDSLFDGHPRIGKPGHPEIRIFGGVGKERKRARRLFQTI